MVFIKERVEYDPMTQDVWFPTNYYMFQTFEGKLMTHLEALGLPDKQEKATKDIFRQLMWDFYSDITENSRTAATEKLHPIVVDRQTNASTVSKAA